MTHTGHSLCLQMASNTVFLRGSRLLAGLFFPLLLLGIWEVAVAAGWWPRSLIASPLEVIDGFLQLARTGELFAHTKVSLIRLVSGFIIGSTAGVVVGAAVGTFDSLRRTVAPTLEALIPIPPPAWIPLLIIMFGIAETSKIALITIGAFGVAYAGTVQGIRSADRRLIEVANLYEKSRAALILYVLLPSAAPTILAGLRIALGLSWILLVAAEMIASRMVSPATRLDGLGLGWLIFDARRFGRPDQMIVGMLAIGILGKLSDMLIAAVQRRVVAWHLPFLGQ